MLSQRPDESYLALIGKHYKENSAFTYLLYQLAFNIILFSFIPRHMLDLVFNKGMSL